MKVKGEIEVVQSCRDSMDCRLPGSSIHGIFQARMLEWGAIAFSDESPLVFIYLAVLGLRCSMCDLLTVACELPVVACGI